MASSQKSLSNNKSQRTRNVKYVHVRAQCRVVGYGCYSLYWHDEVKLTLQSYSTLLSCGFFLHT